MTTAGITGEEPLSDKKPLTQHHQRLMSYQAGHKHGQQTKVPTKQRPVSSVPQIGNLQTLTTRADAQKNIDGLHLALSSDTNAREDFVNVRQMLDPTLSPLTIRRTNLRISDTDMQSAMFSNKLTRGDIVSDEAGNMQEGLNQSKVQGRPKSSQYSRLQGQATKATTGFKSSQNLIQQLRVKSVRQSKVRIVADPSSKDRFDIVIDKRDQGERHHSRSRI